MTITARTDIHRPSAPEFDPESYDLLGVYDLEDIFQNQPRVDMVQAHLALGHSFAGAPHGSGQCSHCGTAIRYAALMLHAPTGTLLYIGETCLDNRFEGMTAPEFQALRKAAALNRERVKRTDRIAALVESHPLLAWLTYPGAFAGVEVPTGCEGWTRDYCYLGGYDTGDGGFQAVERSECPGGHTKLIFGDSFLSDVAYKFTRDGALSDKQIAAVEAAIPRWTAKIDALLAKMAAEAAEGPGEFLGAEKEKVTITGEITVAQTIDVDSQWGARRLVVVSTPAGLAKITGTSAWLWDAEKGQTVTVTGTVKGHGAYRGKNQTLLIRTKVA